MIRKRLFILLYRYFLIYVGFGVFFTTSCNSSSNNQTYLRIPITISSTFGIPILNIEIEKIQYPVEVDLGMAYQLYVDPKVLKKIKNKKKEINKIQGDIRGNLYETQSFQIPSIRLKHWEIKNIVVSEEDPTYISNTVFWIPSEKIKKEIIEKDAKIKQGSIGWPIFAQFACFFNFSHSEIVIGKNIASLREAGYSMNEFIQIPFSVNKGGIILSMTTDLGIHQFLLDTGVSCSMIRQKLVPKEKIEKIKFNVEGYTTESMLLNEQNLGRWTFKLFEISECYDQFDGILGVDFFKKRAVCLDFQNQMAYIKSNSQDIK